MGPGDNLPEQIQKLTDMESSMNQGRGVRCVKDILRYLRLGQLSLARGVRMEDGDKIRVYPGMDRLLTEILGCRMHGVQRCEHPVCKGVK